MEDGQGPARFRVRSFGTMRGVGYQGDNPQGGGGGGRMYVYVVYVYTCMYVYVVYIPGLPMAKWDLYYGRRV